MSDKKTTITPIIVGAVIALLGILTGLYIATNAREQLQAQTEVEELKTADEGLKTKDEGQQATDLAPLPDLPAVDETPAPVVEEPVVVEIIPDVEDMPIVTTDGKDMGAPDDFVPVSPEEIERAISQQQDTL